LTLTLTLILTLIPTLKVGIKGFSLDRVLEMDPEFLADVTPTLTLTLTPFTTLDSLPFVDVIPEFHAATPEISFDISLL